MAVDLWSTGVTLIYGYAGSNKHGWAAEIKWHDNKFAENGTVEGVINTKYFEETIPQAIDVVIEVMEQFGVEKVSNSVADFSLYYKGDGEDKDYPPPKGWRKLLYDEARKRGWKSYLVDADYEVVGGED